MKQKLIKLNEQHYIIVDDSEIKDYGTGFYNIKTRLLGQYFQGDIEDSWKKITHSTQPLENGIGKSVNGTYPPEYLRFDKIKQLPLSEVEELVYGFSVKKMAENSWSETKNEQSTSRDNVLFVTGYIAGFKAHQELSKDKLFTVEDMKRAMWEVDRLKTTNLTTENFSKLVDKYIQSLLPKTEWECTMDEQGKLELI